MWSGTSAPSEYMVKVYPIENDFDRFETIGPVSSRDECTAKAMEMKAAAYQNASLTNMRYLIFKHYKTAEF